MVDWKAGMVDTDGCIITRPDRVWPGAELDYSNPANVGFILDHVQEKNPDVTVGLRREPDLRPGWSGPGWMGQIGDRWFINPDRADVLKRMVEASDG